MLTVRRLCRFKVLQKVCNTTLHDTPKECIVAAFARLQSQSFTTHKYLIITMLYQF